MELGVGGFECRFEGVGEGFGGECVFLGRIVVLVSWSGWEFGTQWRFCMAGSVGCLSLTGRCAELSLNESRVRSCGPLRSLVT